MNNKKMLGDFIYEKRKQAHLTKAQLADKVGVSNKAVSKWETLEYNPEISLLPKLAEALNVTTGELLACEEINKVEASSEIICTRYGYSGKEKREEGHYEFVSDKQTKKGKPYVHINLGYNMKNIRAKANGVIAIGNIANGVISIGLISKGILSIGVLALGLLSIAPFALGLVFAVGSIALGLGVSIGAVAVGALAIGAVAIGYLAIGAVAIGVHAHTSPEGIAIGINKYIHK